MAPADQRDARLESIKDWVRRDLGIDAADIAPASADASFRRYFRVRSRALSYIVMDAPPEKENLGPYLRVAGMLLAIGVNVPRVLAQDLARGFLLLSDLGSIPYLERLRSGSDPDELYDDACAALVRIQTTGREPGRELPAYDAARLRAEMQLMPEWFLARHLGIALEDGARGMLERLYELLIRSAAEQPASLVHRDYHSRNLMVCERENPAGDENPGILDFQDAVFGPITYDLVSLFKDCYIAWPDRRVRDWALGYRDRLRVEGLAAGSSAEQFLRWFDLIGLQRHIKVLGIFSRLWYRDGKRGYLSDLPLVLAYVQEAASRYAECAEFAAFLGTRVAPSFALAQARESA